MRAVLLSIWRRVRGFIGAIWPWAIIIILLWGTGDSEAESSERTSNTEVVDLVLWQIPLLGLLIGLLRLAVAIWPRLPARLAVVPNVDQISASMVADLPERMVLVPAPDTRFRNAAALDQLIPRLTARGFVNVGTYVPEGPRVPMVLLANPEERAYAVIWEPLLSGRLRVDFVSVFPDYRRVTYTTDVDRGLNPPPDCPNVNAPGADELALFDRFLAERPAAGYTAVTPETVVGLFEEVSARSFAWRREAGFTREELAAMFGGMIVSALNIFLVAITFLCLPLGLYAIWRYAGADLPAWGGVVLLGAALALVLVPILFAGRIFRFLHGRFGWEGGAPGTPARVTSATEDSGGFSLSPVFGPVYEDPEPARPIAETLRSIGFLPAGAFASPIDDLILWAQPETGVYAVVWQVQTRPWVEMVAAGTDGRCWRVASVAGPDPAGEVYALYDRCLEQRDGLPLAGLTPQGIPHVFEQHVAADPEWRDRISVRVTAVSQEWMAEFHARNRRDIRWGCGSILVFLAVDVGVLVWLSTSGSEVSLPRGLLCLAMALLPPFGTLAVMRLRLWFQNRREGH